MANENRTWASRQMEMDNGNVMGREGKVEVGVEKSLMPLHYRYTNVIAVTVRASKVHRSLEKESRLGEGRGAE